MAKKRNRSNRPRQDKPASPATSTSPAPAKPAPAAASTPPAASAASPSARAPGAKLPPPRSPIFWFGFEVPWAKLALARVVLFGLLAIDAFLQIRHAPRYGAGDFNVGHFSFLDGVGPGRAGYEVGQLLSTYLFALAALGIATRLVIPLAAVLYAWLYFGSQLDSYQHHYLVALLVAIACFVPWQRPPAAEPGMPVRSWAVRLILVQLGVMYLWAAISKLDPAWVSGRTLQGQLTGAVRTIVDGTVGMQVASVLVIAIELALAGMVWLRPAWKIAAPLGIAFHAGILMSGLEIGLFAYLMLGLYLLVLPDAFVTWLAEALALPSLQARIDRLAARTSWLTWALALAAGIAIAALVRLEYGLVVAIAASAIPVALGVRARLAGAAPSAAIGAAHVVALALWLVADRASSVAVDYYKYWAGANRRLGDLDTAEYAYRRLVDVAPDLEVGHYYLGRILTTSRRGDAGVPHLHRAQRLEPGRARAYLEEARWLASQGKHAEAVAKAREGAFAEPSSSEARALLENLIANRPAPAGPSDDNEPL